MLNKIVDVQKVGRFERLEGARVNFTKVMLIFGENGWGKSTIADLLRSVTTGSAEILNGRETLASPGSQMARLLVDRTPVNYSAGTWAGAKPTIAIYDQRFINDNVYSGDAVSLDHLKRQYGIVIGSVGVSLVRSIEQLNGQIAGFDQTFREAETIINTALRTHGLNRLSIKDFVTLEPSEEIDRLITEKTNEIGIVEKSAEIGRLSLPDALPVPTGSMAFREALAHEIDDIAVGARQALQAHIAKHSQPAESVGTSADKPALSHEEWIEAGLRYQDSDHCAFCGQFLNDSTLIETYRVFFGARYKELAADIRQRRATLQRYLNGDFRTQLQDRLKENATRCLTWQTLTGVASAELDQGRIEDLTLRMERCAATIDRFCETKQGDLIEAITHPDLERALGEWDDGRDAVLAINADIEAQRTRLSAVREGHAAKNLDGLKAELALLNARRLRDDASVKSAIENRTQADLNKTGYTAERNRLRSELTTYSNTVADTLGKAINGYLHRLGAGFRIDYQSPNFRGKEPAASYAILINNVPVPPRSGEDNIAQPSFRNTLSTGDKSVLALAFFLASLATDSKIDETIVVLDDPFTSLDEFRRTFTVTEIKKLVPVSNQVIVLSHDKAFLRLLWERIDQSLITAVAIQTGAPGLSTLTPFDIETSTLPRHQTERTKMLDFLDDTAGAPPEIRALLRKVLEHFYRQADPENFSPNEMLDGIVRFIKSAPSDYRYKSAYDDLDSINYYTRNFHHAPVPGSVMEDTNVEELKSYCRMVRDLTNGYV